MEEQDNIWKKKKKAIRNNTCRFITSFQPCVEFPLLVEDGVAVCADEDGGGDDEVGALLVLEGEDEAVID